MSWEEWNKRLKAHMKAVGVTQDQVAEHFEMTQGAVAHWLSKRNEINLVDFMRLCSFTQADPRRILFGETEPAVVLSQLQTMLEENPALRDMVARPRAPDERVAAHISPAPQIPPRRTKAAALQRRKKGK
jgi:transcriptional regulator with XRE-family HTH domain